MTKSSDAVSRTLVRLALNSVVFTSCGHQLYIFISAKNIYQKYTYTDRLVILGEHRLSELSKKKTLM